MSLDIQLRIENELSKKSPDYRLVKEEIVSWFNSVEGRDFPEYDRLTEQQRHEIVVCLNKHAFELAHIFSRKEPALTAKFHTTLSDKVSYIAQHHCRICTEKFPMSKLTFVLPPHSHQAADSNLKKAFKRAILHYFEVMSGEATYFDRKICLHITFAMKESRRDKDVDNMAKLLIDSLKNVLFSDDKEIVHLSVIKIRKLNSTEHISVNIRESRLPDNKDVFSEEYFHEYSAPILNISEFLDNVEVSDQ